MVPLTPQSVQTMQSLSRFSPFPGIKTFLKAASHILVHRQTPLENLRPGTHVVCTSCAGFFSPALPNGWAWIESKFKHSRQGRLSFGKTLNGSFSFSREVRKSWQFEPPNRLTAHCKKPHPCKECLVTQYSWETSDWFQTLPPIFRQNPQLA